MVGFAQTAVPTTSLRRVAARPDAVRLALFGALFAVALLPVLTTPIPAMVDYVNHLARMYELAAQGTPQASPFYHADWKFYPNLAMDIIVPLIARWTGVEAATRLFLLLSQILVVTGSVAVELRVKRRFAISGFVAVLYLFNAPFAWGFLNFEFAVGVALWGIAAWLAVRAEPWPARVAVHTLFVVTLFTAHLFALGLYGATLAIHEAWCARRSPRPLQRLLGAWLLLATPAALLAMLMLRSGGSVGGDLNVWWFVAKPFWPFLLLNGDNLIVSATGMVVLGCLVHALWRGRELGFLQSGAWLALGFVALYLAVPSRLLDTAFVDIRVLVGAVLILPAFVSVTIVDAARARAAAAVVAAVTIANIACVLWVWSSYQPIYREMIASFAKLSPHARVLVSRFGPAEDPPVMHLDHYPLYHAPTLAVHYAGAFVPTLFTTAGKQPLTVADSVRRLSFSCGGPVPLDVLRKIAIGETPASAETGAIKDWTRDFDYVYVLGSRGDEAVPKALDLVDSQTRFSLYQVRR